ncbi:MAG: DinB family protein [Gemmatimonadaceae bacterium]
MSQHIIHRCMQRELRSLERELAAYPDDASVWALPPGIKNSAGTLALHLAGNLQHFVGGQLGKTGYVRNREAEFARRGASRAELAREIHAAAGAIDAGFTSVNDDVLASEFPEKIAGITFTTLDWLVHLSAHLGYHIGQIDYHRRLVTGDETTVDAVPVKELG